MFTKPIVELEVMTHTEGFFQSPFCMVLSFVRLLASLSFSKLKMQPVFSIEKLLIISSLSPKIHA